MEDSKSGMSWIGVLFVILVIWAILGGGFGNGFGWGSRGGCVPEGGCSRIYEAQQSEKIFDLKMENMSLKNNFCTKELVSGLSQQLSDCCCAFNRRLDGIECNMLTKPNLYGVATTCSGQTIPSGFNMNPCNPCGPCGGNRNI